MKKIEVAIIAAMEEECKSLIALMKEHSETVIGTFTFHLGLLENKQICLLQCGIGKVNAAIGTALLLNNWTPDYLINTGVAGGFQSSLSIGDIVLSTEVLHHDADATVFGYIPGQIPGMPETFLSDKKLLSHSQLLNPADSSVTLVPGIIASGDAFIHRDEQVDYIRKEFPNAAAVDMESAAIAQGCFIFNIPFLIIRSISDVTGDNDNHISYDEFMPIAARNSIDIVRKILTSYKP